VKGHLRLVPPPGEAPAPPARRHKGNPSPALSLSDDEVKHLRAATRNIARTFGSIRALARALGVDPGMLTRKKRPGPGLAVALWRLTGIPVETLLRPTLAAVPAPAPVPQGGAA
jgi:hypothetical protein